MFGAARWRLTVWFITVLGVVLAVTAVVVYLATRAVLFSQVNSDLQSRASREGVSLVVQLQARSRGSPHDDVAIGPRFTTAGYFYALVTPAGEIVATTPNVDPAGLAGTETLQQALDNGPVFKDTQSSEGVSLRVLVVKLETPRGGPLLEDRLLMEVGRSVEPERGALRLLLLVFAGVGGGGLALASIGGYLLAGIALRPIRVSVDSQRGFIADASHELRTPISVIRANAELLSRHASEPVNANRDALTDIVEESDRLGRLVGQMLTLAQADAGQAKLSLSEVALDELAREVARNMLPLAKERGIALETAVDGPVRLSGDTDRLRELLVILTDNAIKYTDAGGDVRLEVHGASDGKAIVRVSDTGWGIPAEALPRVFDRFYRVDQSRSRDTGGAGLGLAIARWIAEAHGGSIRVESTSREGTTLVVELPV